MKSLYKLLAEQNKKSQEYIQNYIFYSKEIKMLIKDLLPDAKILVFGSVIKGTYRINSDIDILVISSKIPKGLFEQGEIKLKIKEKFPDAPFEIHLVTPYEYENWYKKFIKEDYIYI
ncbi:MAG: nucleotidyltransferase domain-containing protein [Endomicrobiia bacterium]